VKQLNADSLKKVTDAIGKAVQAGSKGDEAGAKAAVAEANAITKDWVTKIRAEADKAANPEFATALKSIADQVEKLEGEDATLEQMNKTVQDASATLNKYCS
jgi:hypothetical protein